MRSYTVATVALTLGVTPKWIDNAITRFRVPGVIQKGQGVSRRLNPQSVVTLHLATELNRNLGVPLSDALRLAHQITTEKTTAHIALFPFASLSIDIDATTRDISHRLAHAVEVAPVPRRGRPRLK